MWLESHEKLLQPTPQAQNITILRIESYTPLGQQAQDWEQQKPTNTSVKHECNYDTESDATITDSQITLVAESPSQDSSSTTRKRVKSPSAHIKRSISKNFPSEGKLRRLKLTSREYYFYLMGIRKVSHSL